MSQDDFARAIRDAGLRLGAPNDANKRLVQRWEAGTILAPRPVYARALEAATGLPLEALGFADADMPRVTASGNGGHDLAPTPDWESPDNVPRGQAAGQGNYTGVWLSRYEYYSSGREETFVDAHYVILVQHGDRLTVRSLPGGSINPDSQLTMDLTVDGSVITGTWSSRPLRTATTAAPATTELSSCSPSRPVAASEVSGLDLERRWR